MTTCRDKMGVAVTAILVVIAVLSSIWNASGRGSVPKNEGMARGQFVPNWSEFGNARGDSAAHVRIVVFSDYECEGCRQLHASLKTLKKRFGDQLDVIVRHYPLTIHPAALVAARAAVCADAVGAFAGMNDWIFETGVSGRKPEWVRGALASGVRDTAAFELCRTGEASLEIVTRDVVAGRSLGVMVTPSLLLDSLLFGGAPKNLETLIARSIADATR